MTRRRRKVSAAPIDPTIIIELDQVYRAINRVQLTRENVTFKVLSSESAVIDNILKDLELPYKKKDLILNIPSALTIDGRIKKEKRAITEYHVEPAPVVERDMDFEEMDEFPDELLEDGQLFF